MACFTFVRISTKVSRAKGVQPCSGSCHNLCHQVVLIILCCASTGCAPGLDGATSAQNGLEADCGNEEYVLMSIDNIINGKVGAKKDSVQTLTTLYYQQHNPTVPPAALATALELLKTYSHVLHRRAFSKDSSPS